MNYDGVIIKLDELFLFLFDPDEKVIKDGINISEHECYKDLNDNQLMVVDVVFKDGTIDIEKIDLDEFIYGDTYGRHDVFIYIKDKMLFYMNDNKKLKDIIDDGGLNELAIDVISYSKNELNKKIE